MQDISIDYIVRNTTGAINLELPNILRTGAWGVTMPVFNFSISTLDPNWIGAPNTATLRDRAFQLQSFIYRRFSNKIYLMGNIPSSSATEANGSPSNVLGSAEEASIQGADLITFCFKNTKDILDREIATFSGVTFLQLRFMVADKETFIPLVEDTGYASKIVDTSTGNVFLCSPITFTLKFSKIE